MAPPDAEPALKRKVLDPVDAYDRLAPDFARLSSRRRAYLDSIDQFAISEILTHPFPHAPRSLLDVGAGSGARASRIAQACTIPKIVLLEPSANMRAQNPSIRTEPRVEIWPIRAEQLHLRNAEFDVVLCLWNVLGHIFPAACRCEVLRQFARLLSPRGIAVIDVNNRYNVRAYGLLPTAARWVYDRFLPGERNGDVIASWKENGSAGSTRGHVFTDAEFVTLASHAGFTIHKTIVVDYSTGRERLSSFEGSLFYVLRRMA